MANTPKTLSTKKPDGKDKEKNRGDIVITDCKVFVCLRVRGRKDETVKAHCTREEAREGEAARRRRAEGVGGGGLSEWCLAAGLRGRSDGDRDLGAT
eukprot:667590-Rhodomonas_salina.1